MTRSYPSDIPTSTLPRVSVLMPGFPADALHPSLHRQPAGAVLEDWELIVVDDGSPDETALLVAPYLSDARISYQRCERNQGLGAALNLGLERARAPFIAYLPSDDVYSRPSLIPRQKPRR